MGTKYNQKIDAVNRSHISPVICWEQHHYSPTADEMVRFFFWGGGTKITRLKMLWSLWMTNNCDHV